jgi:hypothetical protein
MVENRCELVKCDASGQLVCTLHSVTPKNLPEQTFYLLSSRVVSLLVFVVVTQGRLDSPTTARRREAPRGRQTGRRDGMVDMVEHWSFALQGSRNGARNGIQPGTIKLGE